MRHSHTSHQKVIFRILSNRHRRQILHQLNEIDPDNQYEIIPAEFASVDETCDAVVTQLVHTHLPKLADVGYVKWDRDDLIIERGSQFDEIAPLVDLLDENSSDLQIDWP